MKKSAESVAKALAGHGLTCEIKEFAEGTRTAEDAAKSIGCEVGQIAKSLIFKTKFTGLPILIIVSGANRVNEKAMRKRLGENISKPDAKFVREVTGFAIGGIPPIGHENQIDQIYIDKDLQDWDTVWAAAGTPNTVFNIPTKQLIKIAKGKVITIT